MSEPSPTVSDLFWAKIITDDASRLVEAMLDGATDKAALAEGYAVDLDAAVQGNDFAAKVLATRTVSPAPVKPVAVATAKPRRSHSAWKTGSCASR